MSPNSNKVLVVDDNKLVLTMAREVLEGAGYDVVTHDSPLGVSSVVMKERPGLVLLDVNMPVMKGDKVVDIIRKYDEFKNVPILFFSDRPAEELEELTRKTGVDGFIPKSYMGEKLAATVKSIFAATGGSETLYEHSLLLVDGGSGEHDDAVKPLAVLRYRIEFASGVEAGLEAAAVGKHGLVIADDDMGGGGAIAFYEKLTRKVPRLKGRCIFLAKLLNTEFLMAVRKAGCKYLMKPFNPTELMEMVSAMEEKSGISEKRNFVRYKWSGECIIGGETEILGEVLDISVGGVKVKYEGAPLSFGTTVSLNIKSMNIVRDATVMWSSRNGGDSFMGLQVDREIPSIYISTAISM